MSVYLIHKRITKPYRVFYIGENYILKNVKSDSLLIINYKYDNLTGILYITDDSYKYMEYIDIEYLTNNIKENRKHKLKKLSLIKDNIINSYEVLNVNEDWFR
jgi:hypothetical protein